MKSNLEIMSIASIKKELMELESVNHKSSIILSSIRALTRELQKRRINESFRNIIGNAICYRYYWSR